MALLFTAPVTAYSSSSSSLAIYAYPPSARLCNCSSASQQKLHFGLGILIQTPFLLKGKSQRLIVKAASGVDGTNSENGESPPPSSESDEESIPVQKLPLESKLQLKLEQKMKMKLDKKIRLRRKKLVRKRILRKKGRWPPSKLKKNKNV